MNPITAPELLRKAAEILETSDKTLFVTEGIAYAAGMTREEFLSVHDSAECGRKPETVLRRAADVLEEAGDEQQSSSYNKALEFIAVTKQRASRYLAACNDFYIGGTSAETLEQYNNAFVKPELQAYTNQVLIVSEAFGVPEEKVCDDVSLIVDGSLPVCEVEEPEPERKEPSEILREVIERYAEQTLKEDEVEDESYICVGELETLSEAVKAYYEVAR